jgi:hypothetical protein
MVQLLEGETAVQAEAAAKAQAHRTREHLKEALATKTAELASAKKMIQKPTLMERELAEQGAELERTRAELLDAHKRIMGHERRATMAEERVAALRIEMGKEREKVKREVAAAAASERRQRGRGVPPARARLQQLRQLRHAGGGRLRGGERVAVWQWWRGAGGAGEAGELVYKMFASSALGLHAAAL